MFSPARSPLCPSVLTLRFDDDVEIISTINMELIVIFEIEL